MQIPSSINTAEMFAALKHFEHIVSRPRKLRHFSTASNVVAQLYSFAISRMLLCKPKNFPIIKSTNQEQVQMMTENMLFLSSEHTVPFKKQAMFYKRTFKISNRIDGI